MPHTTDAIVKGKEVDVSPLFARAKMDTGRIIIVETEGMYPYKNIIEDNWAYFTAVGMKRFREMLDAEGKVIRNIGIVGICSGVEGIAVMYLFKNHLKHLVITDIDAEILKGTVFNLKNYAQQFSIDVNPLVGSMCEPILDAGLVVDFVHANIPNLPAQGTEDLSKGAEKGTFLPRDLYEKYNPPAEFIRWALGAQYAYLTSAKKVIPIGGSIITELGGRVPMHIISKLFSTCGLEIQEVIVGFKKQTEALIDFEGYHRFEKEFGVEFEFYRYKESIALLSRDGLSEPNCTLTVEKYKRMLMPYKISAGEALDLHHKNLDVGHTVHLFRGIKVA